MRKLTVMNSGKESQSQFYSRLDAVSIRLTSDSNRYVSAGSVACGDCNHGPKDSMPQGYHLRATS